MQHPMRLWVVVGVLLCGAVLGGARAEAQQALTLTLEGHRFDKEAIRVPANAAFVLTVVNKDKEDEEFEISALRLEKIIPGGKTLQLKMPALKPGSYAFVGEFHEATAKGRLIAE